MKAVISILARQHLIDQNEFPEGLAGAYKTELIASNIIWVVPDTTLALTYKVYLQQYWGVDSIEVAKEG